MSLVSALYTGVSGIQTFSANMQVIGNNIANVNTVGFKSTASRFADLVSAGLERQIGRGVRLHSTSTSFEQGSFQNTSNVTDLAIDGDGFFVIKDPDLDAFSYTRTGYFTLDKDGLLINPDSQLVQGYGVDALGGVSTELTDINLNNLQSPPQATAEVQVFANLQAEEQAIVGGFDETNPTGTSNYFTSVTVYDSQGIDHTVTLYFTKTSDNNWTWNALVADAEISNPDANSQFEIEASGTLVFGDRGQLVDVTYDPPPASPNEYFNFVGGVAQNQQIIFDFGDTTASGGDGSGTSQVSNPSLISFMSQDGFSAGSLRGISIGTDGMITGVFSNGKTRNVAQVALATFQNETGLIKTTGNTWIKSPSSGEPTIQPPGSGAAGSIISNALELSNVDLANEFVQLIATQRALQASSRMLTTSDDMLQEVVNLKR